MIYDIEEILRLAKAKGLTQKKLMQLAKVNKSTLHRIRKGKTTTPRLATMMRIIEVVSK